MIVKHDSVFRVIRNTFVRVQEVETDFVEKSNKVKLYQRFFSAVS